MSKRKQVSFTLNKELMDELQEYCIKNDYNYAILLEMIIENYLPKE